MKILCVEDNPVDADLTRRALLRHDPESSVDVATTLADARSRLAQSGPYDLVLSDVALPDGTGPELVSEIREQGLPVAVVMLTGTGDVDTVVAALKAGADDYLIKGAAHGPRLPLTLESALARFRADAARKPGILRLMYAEPDAVAAEATRRHLERHAPNIRLEVIGRAGELLRRIRHAADLPCPCDVLLLECRMEGDASLDVLKTLLAEGRLHVPVVMLGGAGDEQLAAHALRLGANVHYLVKHQNYLYALPATLESAHRSALLAREEAALRDSQARLAGLVDTAMDAIISIDAEQRIVLFNPAAEKMFRSPRDQVIGQSLDRFIPERFRGAHPQWVRDFARTGVTRRRGGSLSTITGLRGDCEEFPIEASISKVHVGGQDLYSVILRDVTEHTRRIERLRESEERFRQLAENIQEVFWIWDPAANKVLYVSPAYDRIWGRSREVLYANAFDWLEPIHPEDRPRAEEALQSLASVDYRIVRGDGSVRWIHDRAFPVRNEAAEMYRVVGVAEDITERKRAEDELRQAEERFRTLYESATVGLYRTTPDGRILMANPAALRMLGYHSFDELAHRNLENEGFEPSYPRSEFQARLEGAGVIIGLESAWIRRDGSRISVRESARLVRDEKGAPLHYDGTFEDITERKRAERQLEEEKALSETLLASLPGIVYVIDRNGGLVRWNHNYEEVVGRSREDLLGSEALQPVVDEDKPLLARKIRDVLERGGFEQAEGRLRDARGELRDHVFSAQRVEIAGEPFLVGTALDVTDRKRAETELRRSEERFRSYVENAPLAVFVADPGGRIVDSNPAAVEMLGYDAASLSTMSVLDLHPLEDREATAADVGRLSKEGRLAAEVRMRRRDGTTIWVSLRVALTPDGRSMAYCQDVTERRNAEEQQLHLEAQLRQAQKMEAIGRLAGGVAHDFNNMLNVILGYVDLALRKLSPVDPIRKNLNEIRSAAERSADLTRRLLAFSRRQTIAPRVLDLNAQLEGMDGLLRRIIGEDVDLELLLGKELWSVSMDPSQVDQVVANLAVNARDAMPDGGKLSVATGNVTLDEAYCQAHADARPGDYALLAVSDTGCGMDAQTLERAFEPFFTTKVEGKGTGLGLAMVYGIARQNGGSVEIESEVGRGTTFKVYIPRLEGGEEKPGPIVAPPAAPRRGHETILLVEDEPSLRELAQELLQELGYKVLAAASPGEAISLCEKDRDGIDLLLTDVVMPVMNGKELSERIRTLKPQVKVLFTSGYTADAIAIRGVLEPGVQFLEKPFSLDALAHRVRAALSGG